MMEDENVNESDEQYMCRMYKRVFAHGEGQMVLEDMLNDLHLLHPCNNEHDMVLNNYAKTLVVKVLGDGLTGVKPSRLWRLLKKLTGKVERRT